MEIHQEGSLLDNLPFPGYLMKEPENFTGNATVVLTLSGLANSQEAHIYGSGKAA